MRLAEDSVPKTTCERQGGRADGGVPDFCSLGQAAARFLMRTAGKILFVSDAGSYARLAFIAANPRAVCLVTEDGDALSLFSMPDGVGGVFAAGGADTLTAARYFAAVRRVPCALAPTDGACDGVIGARCVLLDGERVETELAAADVFCDCDLMSASLPDARGRLALARLARFEARALTVFGEDRRALGGVTLFEGMTAEETVRANLAVRADEAAGGYAGEGGALARSSKCGAREAARALSALYAAFFKRGRPRKYTVADYAGRAAQAGTFYGALRIPDEETFARRALIFERRRADLLREAELAAAEARAGDAACEGAGTEDVLAALKRLPEAFPDGLTAVIRDFGLLE